MGGGVFGEETMSATRHSCLRLVVADSGLYRISASQIADGLTGWAEVQARQAIAQTNFVLSCGGTAVAWRAESGDAALLFFGQAYRDIYTDRNVYWLEPGPGLAMASADQATSEIAIEPWFWESTRVEQNILFRPNLHGGLEDDYFMWFGQQLTAPLTDWLWTCEVPLIDRHPDVREAMVTAYLASGHDGPAAFENRTRLLADGQLLDDRQWSGAERLSQSGMATNLTGTRLAISIEGLRATGVATNLMYVDALEVRYARRLQAHDDQLQFQPEPGTDLVTVRGFSNSAIRVMDVTDPLRPVEIKATVAPEGASWRASWMIGGGTLRRFLAAAGTKSPERMEGACHSGWDQPNAGAPHLVITPQALTNVAATLVMHRRGQGLDSILVPLEELYDAFACGRRDPRAIARFLAYARANWTVPPAYVCLAGDGHLDYHDHFDQGLTRPNHVPPLLQRVYSDLDRSVVAIGLDNPLADTDGDGMPDCAIGRLPAQSPEALARMINRILAHEAADAWKSKVLLVADWDGNKTFSQACLRLAKSIPPGIRVQHLNRTSAAREPMRTGFIAAMNSGPALAVYLGHGNNIALGSGDWFFRHSNSQSDMPALTNRMRAPLLLAGTCLLNNFSKPAPTDRCIGTGFLAEAAGGAVAVWASAMQSSLSVSEDASRTLLDNLMLNHDVRLGDLVMFALEAENHSITPWVVAASVLLGDPGTQIRTHMVLDHTPPSIQMTRPTIAPNCATTTNPLDLAGTALDGIGVKQVVVHNSRNGAEKVAEGTTKWRVTGLALEEGANLISATAYDSAGNAATDTLHVVYTIPPILTVTPTNQSLSYAAGTMVMAVTNTGKGTLAYAAAKSATWLTIVAGSKGTNTGTVVVSYAANPGRTARSATVTVTAPSAFGSPVVVRVTQAGNPVLTVSPASWSFGTLELGTSADRTFIVKNSGGSPLAGAATVPAPFTIVSGGSYTLGPGQSQSVTVRYNPAVAGSDKQRVSFTGGAGAVRQVVGSAKARLTAEVPGGGGTVAGAGLYAPGIRIALTPRPAPGHTFLHWEDGSQVSARKLTMPNVHLSVTATFGVTAIIPPPAIGNPGHQVAMVGVPFGLPLDITSESLPTVTVTGLPAGLKYNAASKSILGTPTIPVTNKLVTIHARNTAGKVAVPVAFTLTVEPLPAWAWGSYNGWCLIAGNPDIGSAVMTVSRQGKISGKLSAGGVHYSFRASSYAAGSNAADGFSFAGNAVAGRATLPLTIVVEPAGGISSPAGLGVANNRAVGVDAVMYRNVWSDADMRASATNFNGYYTVTLPDMAAPCAASDLFGSGYLTITLNRGAVKAAGKLADGTAVSMSSTLLVDASNRIFTVLYSAPATYKGGCLFGMAEFLAPVEAGAGAVLVPMDGESFVWESRNPLATGTYGEGFVRDLDLAGGWYNKLDNLYAYYTNMPLNIGTGALAPAPELLVGANRVESGWWNPGGLPLSVVFDRRGVPAGLAAPKAAKPVKVDGAYAYEAATNTVGLTFSAVKTTGLFKGAFKAWFDYGTKHTAKSISFAGVMTPRRADPQDGIEGRGFFLWTDKSQYTNSRGRSVPYVFKWSYDFIVESEP